MSSYQNSLQTNIFKAFKAVSKGPWSTSYAYKICNANDLSWEKVVILKFFLERKIASVSARNSISPRLAQLVRSPNALTEE